MRKVLIIMLAVLSLCALVLANYPNANPKADPDEDWEERMAAKELVKPRPVLQKGDNPLAAGDYYIPKGSHDLGYDSLHIAVDSINVNGVTGTVNLILDADTLREPSFTFMADLSVDNNVVVKPATGRDVCLIVTPGASMGNGAQMIGFDKGYVTFDGSNNGTDSRNLTVTTETNDTRVPFGLNTTDADTVVLKNLIIKNLDNVTDNFKYGAVTNDVGGIKGFTVENCQIGTPERPVWRDGVAVWGDWTNLYTQGIVVDNEIHTGARGISTYIFGDCVFNNNTVYLYPSATTYEYNYGIYLSWGPSAEVHNNVIHAAVEKTTGSVTKIGGVVTASHPAGAEFSVVNNMVDAGASDETVPVYGFLHMSGNDAQNFSVYHNTFVVNDNASADPCHGVGNSSTGPVNMDLKNNIVINNHTGNTESSAISLVSTSTVLSSNSNDLVSNQNCVYYQDSSYADLADWQGTGQDVNSDSVDVTFVAANDLHLAAPSDTDLDLVVPKISEVDMDIDGDPRLELFYAYAGADEGTAYPVTNDLHIGFADDSDLANWDPDGWESVSVNSELNALQIKDAGWSMGVKRPVNATYGSIYKLVMYIKTAAWEGGTVELSVEGLGNDQISKSIISEDTWTEYSIIGIAGSESGNIYISGSYPATHNDTVWVDSLSWDDQYLDVYPSDDIAAARAVPVGDTVACTGVVTATTIGAPIFMQDETAGISLYDWDFINDGIVKEGDEILVIGERAAYHGLEQISYVDDNYIVLSEGNPVEPTLITVPDLDSRDYQGMLVKIEDVDTVAGEFSWPAEGSDATITLMDADSNQFNLRIDKDGDMDGATPPKTWPLTLFGVVGEYYDPQVMPRYMEDFNSAPDPFTILNPADGTVITSLDDPNIDTVMIDAEEVLALFTNWSEAIDPDMDTVTYEVLIWPEGPEEALVTQDTSIYIALEEEEPWTMNGTYYATVMAMDAVGGKTYSDTVEFTFDIPAPPEITYADVVLVDNMPQIYAQFNLPFAEADVAHFTILDESAGTATTPTAIDSLDSNIVMLSGDLPEDHHIALAYSDIVTPGGTVSVTDTVYAGKVLIPFSANHPEDAAQIITDFESDVGSFLDPNWSGSTSAADASTFEVSDEAAYRGTKSGKMTIIDKTDTEGGWYVRELYGYPFAYSVSTTSTIMFVVKGTNTEVEMRLSVKDSGYEQGPWTRVSLSEDDWQVVSFDLENDDAEGWITGNGEVEGETVLIEGIHMRCAEDVDVVLYIDEFTERPNSNSPPSAFTMVQPTDGYEITEADVVQDSLIEVKWTQAVDPDGDAVSYEFFLLDAAVDTLVDHFTTSDTSQLLDAPGYEDNGNYKFYVLAYDPWDAFSSSDTVNVTVNMPEVGIDDGPAIPKSFALHQNYPNPFNPTTTIKYDLPEAAFVKLVIYDIMGREIRTLISNKQNAGYKSITWNGRDRNGRLVSSGLYIYHLTTDKGNSKIKKMTFMK